MTVTTLNLTVPLHQSPDRKLEYVQLSIGEPPALPGRTGLPCTDAAAAAAPAVPWLRLGLLHSVLLTGEGTFSIELNTCADLQRMKCSTPHCSVGS